MTVSHGVTNRSNMELELGFINPPVSRTREDEAEYTRLQIHANADQQFGNATMESEGDSRMSESTTNDPEQQPAEYAEVPDPIISQSATIDPQEQPAEYLEMLDSSRSQSATNGPQEQPAEYTEVPDPIRSQFNRNHPKRQPARCAQVPDPIRSQSATNDPEQQPGEDEEKLNSKRSESESEDSQSQYDGCVSTVDYPECIPIIPEISGNTSSTNGYNG